jgi:hypothetical protein
MLLVENQLIVPVKNTTAKTQLKSQPVPTSTHTFVIVISPNRIRGDPHEEWYDSESNPYTIIVMIDLSDAAY